MIVLYQSYGPPDIYNQVRFSIETLRRRDPAALPAVVIYAQEPAAFGSLGVRTVPLDAETIRRWQGPLAFVHRLKIHMIVDAMARFGDDVLYLDGDTFWQRDTGRLAGLVGDGTFVFHNYEGRMGDKGLHHWLHEYFKRVGKGSLPPFSADISPHAPMYNAGVLGLPFARRELLLDVLRLTDELLLRCYQTEWLEQLAFSHTLSEAGSIETAYVEVAHYWYDKYRSQLLIDRLLAAGEIPLVEEEQFQTMYRRISPRIESRFSRTRRKLRRSIRKRRSFRRARALAAAGYLESPDYRAELAEVEAKLRPTASR